MKNAIICLSAFALFFSACASLRPKESGPPASKVTRDLVGDNIPSSVTSIRSAGPNPYQKHLDYVELYHMKAIVEMERGGVPASIILAQGILESNAGQSDLATNANNHFGIKCGTNWSGKSYKKKDDDRNEKGELIESCFRKYEDVSESFYDHSEFLRDPRKHGRYGPLFNLDRTDYKGWARGLQASGYATSPDYADKLIAIIERYNLNQYDRMSAASAGSPVVRPSSEKPDEKRESEPQGPSRIGRVNDVKVVLSKPGETLQDIARLYKLNPNMVANYNDRGYTPGQTLKENTRIYIMPKKDSWNGRATHHFVREGQTMFDIAQLYGLRLDKLRQRNNIRPGFEPVAGEKIRLKGSLKKGEQPQIYQATPGSNAPNPGTSKPAPQPNPGLLPSEEPPFVPEPDKKPTTPGSGSDSLGNPAFTGVPYPADPTPATPFDPNPPYSPPAATPPPAPSPGAAPTPSPSPDPGAAPPGFHMVKQGDTLFNISRRYGLSVAQLKKLNNMTDDTIKIGQTLKIR